MPQTGQGRNPKNNPLTEMGQLTELKSEMLYFRELKISGCGRKKIF
jgi:hypothetical protein